MTDLATRPPGTEPGWCPFAEKWEIPEDDTQPGIDPYAVIVHSQAGRGSLYGWWLNGTSLESHFWISYEGTIEQYLRCIIRADANGEANRFKRDGVWVGAISIETESRTDATDRWTPKQAAALVKLIVWLCRTYGIPPSIMATPKSDGTGWHVMFGAPGPWTPSRGKTCPGAARIEQFQHEILPAVRAALAGATAPEEYLDMDKTEFDAALKANQEATVKAVGKLLDARGITADPKKGPWGKRVIDSLTRTEGALGDSAGSYGKRIIAHLRSKS